MRLDLHTHTSHLSDDSLLSLEALAHRAREVGLDGLCLTEHDRFWDPEELQRLSRRWGLLLLPGCEVTTEEGHLLVFGLHRYVFGMHRASFVRRLVEEAGGALIIAHPYRRAYRDDHHDPQAFEEMVRRACRNPLFALAHGVEALNGRGSRGENAFAQAVARRLGLPATGGSDAHRPEDLGTVATEFDAPIRSLEDLVWELRAGRCRPVDLRAPGP